VAFHIRMHTYVGLRDALFVKVHILLIFSFSWWP